MDRTAQTFTVLQTAEQPLSTNQVADELGIDWHTAKDALDTLHEQERIYRLERATATVWWDQDIPF